MRAFLSVVLGLVIFLMAVTASYLFRNSEKEEGEDEDKEPLLTAEDWTWALILGAVVGLINYFVPKFYGTIAFMAPICLLLMIGYYVYLILWWWKEGSGFKELIPFLLLITLGFFTTKAASVMTAALVSNSAFLVSLIMAIPEIMAVLTGGILVTNLFYFRYREFERDFDKILAIICGILTALIVIAILIGSVAWKSFSSDLIGGLFPSKTADVEDDASDWEDDDWNDDGSFVLIDEGTIADSTAATGDWYTFYNLSLQVDGDPRNDFNFGPNPYLEGATAETYAADFCSKMANDPALAAGDMAWLDAIVGTRYLGEFYESCKGDWAKTINLTKERFMADQSLYYQTLNAFYDMLSTADSVTLDYQTSDLTDQMYMNPNTVSGVPDVVVMTTDDHSGYYLTYTFIIKDNTFKVSYRIDCGYQPTNVQEVMNIVPDDTPRQQVQQSNPEPAPTPAPTPTPKNDDPKPGGDGDDPKPSPDPTPTPESTPKKDPSKSPKKNTEPNDDPGPGPDTNNGKGAKESTKDQSSNSNHMTQPEYNKAVNDLKETNQKQKTGSDPSTPSTPTPADTHVDNNGDKGNGGDPINTPTPVSDPAIVADTGQAISDNPGEAWGGPPD